MQATFKVSNIDIFTDEIKDNVFCDGQSSYGWTITHTDNQYTYIDINSSDQVISEIANTNGFVIV